jgi:hypothetical protein
MSTEQANRDFVQSAAPNGNDDKSCLWRGLPRFRNYENMKMTALSVTPGAGLLRRTDDGFPLQGEFKIQGQRVNTGGFLASCSNLRWRSASLFSLWKQFEDDRG